MNFKLILGIIGIALIACNIPLLSPMQLFSFIFQIPVYQDQMTWYSLFLLTITAGLVLYVIGRKEFSNRVKGSKIASGLLMFFGLILTLTSLSSLGLASSFLLSDIASSWGPPLALSDFAVYLMIFVWTGLAFISSVLWLVDGAKIGRR